MSVHQLKREQILSISLEQAWDFFSSPKNLSKITPPEMGFDIVSEQVGNDIFEGKHIDYKIRPMFNLPMNWTTEITDVKPPYSFTDVQRKGPYSLWEHRHTFEEKEDHVLMIDQINYALPFGWIGDAIHKFVVKKRLEAIFDFRRKTLNKLFNHG